MEAYGATSDLEAAPEAYASPGWRSLPRTVAAGAFAAVWLVAIGATLPGSATPRSVATLARAHADAGPCLPSGAYEARDEFCNAPGAPARRPRG